jgi:hypothetical protein
MKPWLKLFFSGWLFSTAVHSLEQDAIGQEKYAKLVMDAWISAWVTVPLAVFMIWLALWLCHSARREYGD